jgi:heat-inducible transcriptional repressor
MTLPVPKPLISELNERSREIFRQVVDAYVETGEPVGSRTLSRRSGLDLSPATIRNVMADLEDAKAQLALDIESQRAQLDELTRKVVEAGLASWAGGAEGSALIVRGQAKLLDDVTALADLERLRTLFDMLETKETLLKLLDSTREGQGVQIFIGADNALFGVAGCSVIVAPYANSREQVVGAIGVIGPTRLNYARIIPLVDYTAKVVGRLLG